MLKTFYFYISAISAIIIFLSSCTQITKVTDAIVKPSMREIYAREFKEQPLLLEAWQLSYQNAINENLSVNLPFGETGTFSEEQISVYSYTITMNQGEVLTAEIIQDSVKQRVFMNIFESRNGRYESVQNNDSSKSSISFPITVSGEYKLLLQPEIRANGKFFLNINRKPLYAFPVSGKGNAAIQSLWSDIRDGGKRSHEGVDIFAKRGTPVLAVTDGIISDTDDRGLGGKRFGNVTVFLETPSIMRILIK